MLWLQDSDFSYVITILFYNVIVIMTLIITDIFKCYPHDHADDSFTNITIDYFGVEYLALDYNLTLTTLLIVILVKFTNRSLA